MSQSEAVLAGKVASIVEPVSGSVPGDTATTPFFVGIELTGVRSADGESGNCRATFFLAFCLAKTDATNSDVHRKTSSLQLVQGFVGPGRDPV